MLRSRNRDSKLVAALALCAGFLVMPLQPALALQDDFDLELNLKSFDQVWETIDQTHWDEEVVGDAWDAAREKWRPKAEEATSIAEVRAAMSGLIEELGLSHFGVIPLDAYEAMSDDDVDDSDEELTGPAVANTGLTFRVAGDQIVVSAVREGSNADEQGVKPGWLFLKSKKGDAAEFIEKMKEAAHGPMRYETLVGLTIDSLLTGQEGKKRPLSFQKPDGEEVELEIVFTMPNGKLSKFGHLPEMIVSSKVDTIDGGIGYYAFSAFLDPMRIMPEYRETIADEKHKGGIVIDLRGNVGGLAGMTMGMASVFATEPAELGTMSMKGAELKFAINEGAEPPECPVAVLVDECSISSAEILSGGMQDLKLARIFGSRTAGLALPSQIVKLPNGDGFQFAIADYHSASGKSLEMAGVMPDEEITLSVENLTASESGDPVLDRAVEWIRAGGE